MRAQSKAGGGWEAADQELQKELEQAAARLSGVDKSNFHSRARRRLCDRLHKRRAATAARSGRVAWAIRALRSGICDSSSMAVSGAESCTMTGNGVVPRLANCCSTAGSLCQRTYMASHARLNQSMDAWSASFIRRALCLVFSAAPPAPMRRSCSTRLVRHRRCSLSGPHNAVAFARGETQQ